MSALGPAGDFFVLGFPETQLTPRLAQQVLGLQPAGLILFAQNIETPEQVTALTRDLAATAAPRRLLIAIDQEGGRVQRLRPPHFPSFPAAASLSGSATEAGGRRIGELLASLGIQLDFAPVLDVNTCAENPIIGDRAFGSDPETVAAAAVRFIAGLTRAGVKACGKHFPGHGDTATDSHLTTPTVNLSLAELWQVHLPPFVAAIRAGLDCMMSAHVRYPALDPTTVATYSAPIMTDLLRRQIGFTGVAISDDLGMAGAAEEGDLCARCLAAFAAGCDLLLICHAHDAQAEAIAGFARALEASPALQQRAAESRARLDRFRQRIS